MRVAPARSGKSWGCCFRPCVKALASDIECSASPGAQVHSAVEHALLLRCTLDETAKALEAAGVAPAIFTRLGTPQAPVTANCTAQQLLPAGGLRSAVNNRHVSPPDVLICSMYDSHARISTCSVEAAGGAEPVLLSGVLQSTRSTGNIAFLPSIVEASQMPLQ